MSPLSVPYVAYVGNTEIALIAGVVLVLFGGPKIAQLGKGLGEGIREFKKAMNHDEEKSTPSNEAGS